jgi:hypothetical protein
MEGKMHKFIRDEGVSYSLSFWLKSELIDKQEIMYKSDIKI